MSGHSKWSTIKHKKAALDAKRGKVFTRIIKELSVAARMGGGDPNGNPRLRSAIVEARAANMPADNIKRAIQKGTGELPGQAYEEVSYEGYGPGGVAIFLESLTDNRNRTTPELRHLFTKHGGNLGEPNSVGWMFDKRGRIVVPSRAVTEERLLELVLEAGASDVRQDGEDFEILTPAESFHEVQKALEAAGLTPSQGAVVREASTVVHLEGKKAEACLRLLDALEEHEDVQHVYANLEVDEASLEAGGSR